MRSGREKNEKGLLKRNGMSRALSNGWVMRREGKGEYGQGYRYGCRRFLLGTCWLTVILPSLEITSINSRLISLVQLPGTASLVQLQSWNPAGQMTFCKLLYIFNWDTTCQLSQVMTASHWGDPANCPDFYSSWVPALHLFHGFPKDPSSSPINSPFCLN